MICGESGESQSSGVWEIGAPALRSECLQLTENL